jgi:hypothetical protein
MLCAGREILCARSGMLDVSDERMSLSSLW